MDLVVCITRATDLCDLTKSLIKHLSQSPLHVDTRKLLLS